MHVDGFRFDLASVLGREESGAFRSSGPFFDAVSQDLVSYNAKYNEPNGERNNDGSNQAERCAAVFLEVSRFAPPVTVSDLAAIV